MPHKSKSLLGMALVAALLTLSFLILVVRLGLLLSSRDWENLLHVHVRVNFNHRARTQGLLQNCTAFRCNEIWEFNTELHNQTTTHVAVPNVWHAFIRNAFDIAMLDNLTRIYNEQELPIVKVFNRSSETTECFNKCDLHLHNEVHAMSLEDFMLFLTHNDNNISRFTARLLIPLPLKCYPISVLHPRVNMGFDDCPHVFQLLTVALFASVLGLNNLSLARALLTVGLNLLNHAWTDHAMMHDNAAPVTDFAANHVRAALPITFLANNLSSHGKLFHRAVIELLERGEHFMICVLWSAAPTAAHAAEHTTHATHATAAKETSKDIVSAHAAAAATLLDALLTSAVIQLAFRRVFEDGELVRDLLELLSRLLIIRIFVRMILQGKLAVRLLDLID